ncbi:MAG: ABC transporter permease subunit [Verrucomicrobia bacterium]|nr:ABC transporter permease subunit [Verrucomicrobiota bacterium]
MTFLPIVERELRTRARRPGTYWLRCSAALIGAALAGVMMIGAVLFGPGTVGKKLFLWLAWPAWLFCLLEGVRNTADCLSEEKRHGTLGLLFLTDLKGYDVVLGKFMGAALGAFFVLLAMVPVIGLSLLCGGVTLGEFWRLTLTLMQTLFFSLAAGLFVSSVSRDERRAWSGSVMLMMFFTLGVPWLAKLSGGFEEMSLASPWAMFSRAFETEFARNPAAYWRSLTLVHLMSWGWLALASVLLPRTWEERERGAGREVRRQTAGPGQRRRAGEEQNRLEADPAFLDPIAEPRGRSGVSAERRTVWPGIGEGRRSTETPLRGSAIAFRLAALGVREVSLIWAPVAGAALLVGVAVSASDGLAAVAFPLWLASLGLHTVLAMWIGWEACHAFGDLRRSGLLELLLATPLEVRELIQGQDLALKRRFLAPLVCLLAIEFLFFLALCVQTLGQGRGLDGFFTMLGVGMLFGGSVLLFALDLAAMVRVGMWLSLVSRNPARAWGRTVLWVEVLPFVASLPPAAFSCGIATPGILLAKSAVFAIWAHGKLINNFRSAAAQPSDPRGGP